MSHRQERVWRRAQIQGDVRRRRTRTVVASGSRWERQRRDRYPTDQDEAREREKDGSTAHVPTLTTLLGRSGAVTNVFTRRIGRRCGRARRHSPSPRSTLNCRGRVVPRRAAAQCPGELGSCRLVSRTGVIFREHLRKDKGRMSRVRPKGARLTGTSRQRIRTHRNRNKTGGFRWYNEYELPSEYEGNPLSLRLLGNDEDSKVGLNRTENLRAIPPSDPDFARLFGRRNDTESINRAIDDSLYLRRAHSVGQAAQLADLFGFALLVNARTRARHRARERLKAAAA